MRRRGLSREAWIGMVLASVILASGALVVIRLVLPVESESSAPDAEPLAAIDAARVVSAPMDAPAAALSEERRRELERELDRLPVARRGITQLVDYSVFLTALDWEVAHLVTGPDGRVERGSERMPRELAERVQRYPGVDAALKVVGEYFRGTEQLPPLVIGPLRLFLAKRGPFSREGGGWSAAALAVVAEDRDAERLTALARANDALGRWCAPLPPPKRRRAPELCEPGPLQDALRAAGAGAVADALQRWHDASPEDRPVKIGDEVARIRSKSYSANLDGTWTLVAYLEAPPDVEVALLAGEQRVAAKPDEAGGDGGAEGRFLFEAPSDLLAPVLELTSGGQKAHVRMRAPSLL
jgi:hypothetical protein